MKKKNFAIFEIVCYVVAALLAMAAIYMLYENVAYMNEYLAAYGMTMADLGGQATQSLITAFVPYFTYAFLVFAAGRIYGAVAAPKCECVETAEEAVVGETPVVLPSPAEATEETEEAAAVEEEVTVVLAEPPAGIVAEPVEAESEEAEDAEEK